MMCLRLFIICLVASAASAAAQTPAGPGLTPGTPAPATPAPAAADAPAVAPRGFTYDSQGRRDPFVSVLRTGADPERPAVRPAGLAGLAVSEISLKGTVASTRGFVAILQGVDGKTYLARQGEKLLDGTVRDITQNTLTLLQPVNDPFTKDTQREVRKVLRQTDEAK
jgi:Tfp pilus assembly protein PilP